VENQHRAIKGYRELDEADITAITAINQIKLVGESLGKLVAQVSTYPDVDQRWVAIARTDFQTGLMALTRAIAKPESF
jgi:hypothetical protein